MRSPQPPGDFFQPGDLTIFQFGSEDCGPGWCYVLFGRRLRDIEDQYAKVMYGHPPHYYEAWVWSLDEDVGDFHHRIIIEQDLWKYETVARGGKKPCK